MSLGCFMDVFHRLLQLDDCNIGTVQQVEDHRLIIGQADLFPVQIERMEQEDRFLLYATGVRETAEPVFLPMMITLFLEGLNGHSLGEYGICPGPVTVTLYQKIICSKGYSIERLAAQIACHRLLTECFLEADYVPPAASPSFSTYGHHDQPILPFRH